MFGSTATGTTGFGSAPQQQQPAFGFGTQQTTQVCYAEFYRILRIYNRENISEIHVFFVFFF